MTESQPPASQTKETPKKKNIFKWLFLFCFFLLLAVLLYFFLQEYEVIIRKKVAPSPVPEVMLTSPAPIASPQKISKEIKILDGNVVAVSNGQTEILVNKDDYEQIERFTRVFVSPSGEKMCFLGETMIPMWLFVSQTDGSGVIQVAVAKSCTWNHQSTQLAFTDHTTDVSPVDVYVYDLVTGQTTNLTESVSLKVLDAAKNWEVYRFYKDPVWSADDCQITADYDYLYLDTSGKNGSGKSVINLNSGQIEDIN